LVVGLVFVVHGAHKLVGLGFAGTSGFLASQGILLPTVRAAVLIALELLGGLALVLGAWTRTVAAALAAEMLVAILTVHLRGGFFVPYGVEFPLTLFAACLTLVGFGAGPWSIDGARRR
jgi:putative oxidoreductase